MKTTAYFGKSLYLLIVLGVIALLPLAGCNKDRDSVEPASTAFEGKFEVQDEDPSEKYTLTFQKHPSKKNTFNIYNFGDFMNVPIIGEASGNKLTIPSQTFKNGNGKELTISGNGTLEGNLLKLHYVANGFANFESDIEAVKKAD